MTFQIHTWEIIGRRLVCLVTNHQCWQLAMDSHHIDLNRNICERSDSILVCCMVVSKQKSEIKLPIKLPTVIAVRICIVVLEKSDWLSWFTSVLPSVNSEIST